MFQTLKQWNIEMRITKENLVEVVSSKASADDSAKVGAALLLAQTILRAEEEAYDPSYV